MDVELTYTIPSDKVAEYIDDYCYIHKNTELDGEGNLIFTNSQWAKEHILRYIRSQIVRGKNLKLKDAQEDLNADDVV